jgi:hypothetical protein
VFLLGVIFGKVQFTANIMPDFFLTNKNLICLDYFWQIWLIMFAETCLLADHNARSDKGQTNRWQPLELKLWTYQSLLREM